MTTPAKNLLASAEIDMAALPDAVGMSPNGYLTVQDRPILAALVNAVQTLKTENDALRARLDAMETRA